MFPLVGVSLVSLLAVALIDAYLATTETRSTIDRQLQGVVHVLATSNFPLTDTVLQQMKELSGADFVLADQHGNHLSTTLRDSIVELPESSLSDSGQKVALGPQLTVAGKQYFHSSAKLQNRTTRDGPDMLHTLFPCDQYNAAWRRAFLPPLVVGILAIGAVAAVTQWIAGRISNSLGDLSTGVARLAQGEYVTVELPLRDDEVRDLAQSINHTSNRLADYEQQIRQTEQVRTVAMLGAGLAHEIRNAATGCRLAIDLHAENCGTVTNDDGLAVAKGQLQLMENRLQSFLKLGKENESVPNEEVDLNELVESILPLVIPAARHAKVQIDWRPEEMPIKVLANADTLSMVIVNLLLNAVEAAQRHSVNSYTPPQVLLSVGRSSDNQAELLVCDSGDGPATTIAENLFQPFVSTKAEGVGLGLAVASQVAIAHGGKIDWCRQNGQTVFRFSVPLMEKS
ncbi:sensor histidine kinase [Bythopirellula polymerisocia]|uniref:histidine kinase n=1 Tax=Bythopirellula polymerisocia TaxID=2528003 RepID=A0A5C6D0E3_9BACT|nr:HAMP domain-containing sensor histidine kinase [Bythopirellula polymerisocia]TWU29237.1 Sensor protein ZraS [Bythopirellula polymerisocia]